jgi:hypothetical protein
MRDERLRRLSQNEALFREVNERISDIGERLDLRQLSLICECADGGCAERIELTRAQYTDLRRDETHFVVLRGHETSEIEAVVLATRGFVVVAKRAGVPADTVRQATS